LIQDQAPISNFLELVVARCDRAKFPIPKLPIDEPLLETDEMMLPRVASVTITRGCRSVDFVALRFDGFKAHHDHIWSGDLATALYAIHEVPLAASGADSAARTNRTRSVKVRLDTSSDASGKSHGGLSALAFIQRSSSNFYFCIFLVLVDCTKFWTYPARPGLVESLSEN